MACCGGGGGGGGGGPGSVCRASHHSPARKEGAPRLIIVRMLTADRLAAVLQRPEVGVVLLGHELRHEGFIGLEVGGRGRVRGEGEGED